MNEDNEGKVPQQVIPPPPISKETEDAVEAVRLYRLAADQGNARSQSDLTASA